MRKERNRLAEGMKEIETLLRPFAAKQGDKPGRAYRRAEIKAYEQLLSRYRRGLTNQEKIYRSLIRGQIAGLQKKAYPNPYLRLAVNTFRLVVAAGKKLVREASFQWRYSRSKQEMRSIDNGIDLRPLRDGIRQGKTSVIAASDKQMENGAKLQYLYQWKKGPQGYTISRCQVSTVKNGTEQSILLSGELLKLDSKKIYNLLEGRPVMVSAGKWLKPDHNDRDATGNLKIISVDCKDWDLASELKRNKALRLPRSVDLTELTDRMKAGERCQVNIKGKPVTLLPDPTMRNVASDALTNPGNQTGRDTKGNVKALKHDAKTGMSI